MFQQKRLPNGHFKEQKCSFTLKQNILLVENKTPFENMLQVFGDAPHTIFTNVERQKKASLPAQEAQAMQMTNGPGGFAKVAYFDKQRSVIPRDLLSIKPAKVIRIETNETVLPEISSSKGKGKIVIKK